MGIRIPFHHLRRAHQDAAVRKAGHHLLVERARSLGLDAEDRAEVDRLAALEPGAEGNALRSLVMRCVGDLAHA